MDGLASESGGVCGVVVSVSVGERAVWGGRPRPPAARITLVSRTLGLRNLQSIHDLFQSASLRLCASDCHLPREQPVVKPACHLVAALAPDQTDGHAECFSLEKLCG